MAIGQQAGMVIRQEHFDTGYVETLQQNLNVFNTNSANTIRMVSRLMQGQYGQYKYTPNIANLVSRRDITSIAAATSLAMTQDEFSDVKIHRKIGPVENTYDSFRQYTGINDLDEFNYNFGVMAANATLDDWVNTTLGALAAGLANQSSLLVDITAAATKTATTAGMIAPRNVLGDQKQRIKAIIMHSKPHGDLEADQVGILVGGVANVTIYSGGIGSFGLPVIVTDSDNLVVADAGGVGIDGYYSMFLTEDAATLTESEQPLIREQDVLKLEQITKVIQGEHAFNLGLKGFTWDETNGGPSPTDAALTTGTNWDKKYADDKSLGGSIWLTL